MNNTTLNMTTLDGGVIIKKGTAPAPPSGGESGGSYYIAMSSLIEAMENLPADMTQLFSGVFEIYITYAKVLIGGKFRIVGGMVAKSLIDPTTTILGFSRDLRVGDATGLATIDEAFQSAPQALQDAWQSIPKLTKEQFYSLE